MAERAAKLLLVDGLARIEGGGLRDCLPRVLLELRTRQAERILGLRLAQLIGRLVSQQSLPDSDGNQLLR